MIQTFFFLLLRLSRRARDSLILLSHLFFLVRTELMKEKEHVGDLEEALETIKKQLRYAQIKAAEQVKNNEKSLSLLNNSII
jgi:hypothetical protein